MKKIKELYLKYKEVINYLIFGVLTTIVSLATKYLLLFTILDASNAVIVGDTFYECIRLENLGGFKNLKVYLDLSDSPLLTHQSLMNVINNLATVTTSPTLALGETNLAKLTDDEILIAINKGWTIS